MHFRLTFITAALATLTVATTPALRDEPSDGCNPTPQPASQCTTGPIQCCQTVECANIPALDPILSSLDIILFNFDILVGLNCTPMDVIGGTETCSAPNQAVCCEDNRFSGLISIGCVPVV